MHIHSLLDWRVGNQWQEENSKKNKNEVKPMPRRDSLRVCNRECTELIVTK